VVIQVKPKAPKPKKRKDQHQSEAPAILKFADKGVLERYLRQMFNCDNVLKEKGQLLGVPDDSGDNLWTHTFSTVDVIRIVPNENGEWWLYVTPDYNNHIHYSGGNSAVTNAAGALQGARQFAVNGNKVGKARSEPDYTSNTSSFKIDEITAAPTASGTGGNPGQEATVPILLANESSADHRFYATPQRTKKGGWVWALSGALQGGPYNVAQSFTVSHSVGASGPDGVYMAMWYGLTDEITPGTDVCIMVASAQGNAVSSSNNLNSVSVPSNAKIIYVTWAINKVASSTAKETQLTNAAIKIEPVSSVAVTNLFGESQGFVQRANQDVDNSEDGWTSYRHVSSSVIGKDETAVINKQGRIAGVSLNGADHAFKPGGKITYSSISDLPGSYAGRSEDGVYGFLMPVNMESYQDWHMFNESPDLPDENALVFAGQGAPAPAPSTPSPTFIEFRIVSVWQVQTRATRYAPKRSSYTAPGITAEAMFRAASATFGQGPQITCNPSHNMWGRIYDAIAHGIKSAPKVINTGLEIGRTMLPLAGLLATLVI